MTYRRAFATAFFFVTLLFIFITLNDQPDFNINQPQSTTADASATDADSPTSAPTITTMVYLYPEKTTSATINLNLNEPLLYQFPVAKNNSWQVTAQPDGLLRAEGGDTIDRLYAQQDAGQLVDSLSNQLEGKEGFVVRSENVADFLVYLAEKLGLNEREAKDLTIEAAVQMINIKSEAVFIALASPPLLDKTLPVSLSPKSSQTFKVFLYISPTAESNQATPPNITRLVRQGFTAVVLGVVVK